MTVIDSHAHLWQRARTPQPWIDAQTMSAIDRDFWIDDLVAMQQRAGIDGAVLVQSVNSLQETLDLLELAAVADESGHAVLGVVGWVDLLGDASAQIAALKGARGGSHLVGIRHLAHQDPDPQWLASPDVDLRSLAEMGLTFDLVVFPHQLDSAVTAVAANPDTRFVLDHLGNPPVLASSPGEWRSGVTRLAEFENVSVKISGILPHRTAGAWTIDDLREPVATALSLFGPERMMFGSDWPLVDLAADARSWIDVVRTLIPVEHHAAVFGGTVRRFYLEQANA